MPRVIAAPTVIQAAGTEPKRIEEFVGQVNSAHTYGSGEGSHTISAHELNKNDTRIINPRSASNR
jgi:hypothetical protein